ncbi:amidohydrolase [Hymenobacter properus]|uniref:Amidohydrolase n=1 Tax=Hymenobacter properus TaxID=2791026 RepID=A0A931BJS2_9BACT|nr:amidohydrolase [Hymenobacter properus]MBF9142627.1 amidohydrolase [Hymenobacter properus]MBR7721435.1 amidohydrolase [Microvirga sp. SRT04]
MKKYVAFALASAALLLAFRPAPPPTEGLKAEALQDLQAHYAEYRQAAQRIWGFAEVGYKETKSAALLQDMLRKNGFAVQAGVADMPTAFVATYGSGQPVIGILAEYDALPGLAQQAVAEKAPIAGQDAGHGCGHNLFGTASVAAGIELKKLLKEGKLHGTIKVFGCPAEEGGSGKVYLVRAGLFKGVDAVLHWHPSSVNATMVGKYIANTSAKFRFHGTAAHASAAPERGRSALDGVEAMDHMVNMLREHVPQETRIHYVITGGGKAPNVVPDFAEVYYYVRHPNRAEVEAVFARVVKAAEGAALGTGTTMDYEIIGGTHDLLVNETLAHALQRNLERVGGVPYTPEEAAFGQKIQASLGAPAPPVAQAAEVAPYTRADLGGSSDVGDVSYVVPTVGLSAATWVPGTPAHSWQAVACSGQEIGSKGLMVAAKTMALTGIDLFSDADLRAKAQAELKQQVGSYVYKPLLGDRKPALNYRD